MNNRSRVTSPAFSSSEAYIAYLERKVAFLLQHAEEMADRRTGQENIQLKELKDIKKSVSWRITKPLRKLGLLINRLRNWYGRKFRQL